MDVRKVQAKSMNNASNPTQIVGANYQGQKLVLDINVGRVLRRIFGRMAVS